MLKKFIYISLIIILIIVILLIYFKFFNKEIENNISINSQNDYVEQEDNNEIKEDIEESEMKKLVIKIGDKEFVATLYDNETVKEFINILPLTITMNELNGNEKYYYLNNTITAQPQNVSNIENGDIMLYGTNCLVLFYDTFSTPYSYTKIGKLDNPSGLKEILGTGDVEVEFKILN